MSGKGISQKVVLITDPKVLAIPVVDNGEPLYDLSSQGGIIYGPSPEIPNNQDYTKMRKTVYEKLYQAQSLLPSNIRFCLYEGYRSLQLQRDLFETRLQKLKNFYPSWDEKEVFEETTKLVSPVVNYDGSRNIPPHSTGGAIDVYLIDPSGNALDMGIHPKDWMSDTDGSLSLTASKNISSEAQKNRAMMAKVLIAVGFVNYATEYWHWSYGDRYWAYFKRADSAIYGIYTKVS